MFKQLFLPLIAVAAFIVLVGLLVQGKIGNFQPISIFPSPTPSAKLIKLDDTEVEVEIAKITEERQKGLSGRQELGENSGMLFVMPKNTKPTFWMKDTLFPLDIIWIKDGKVLGISENAPVEKDVPDEKLTLYPAPSVVDYVLEVNAGFSQKNGIKAGSTFQMLFDLE